MSEDDFDDFDLAVNSGEEHSPELSLLYKDFNESVFDNELPSDAVIVFYNFRGYRVGGDCHWRSKKIRIATKFRESANWKEIKATLLHEMVHLAVNIRTQHNQKHNSIWSNELQWVARKTGHKFVALRWVGGEASAVASNRDLDSGRRKSISDKIGEDLDF